MKKIFLTTVEDIFLISGRGLEISPFFPEDKFEFNTNERILIESPTGEESECFAFFQIPLITPKPKKYEFHCKLHNVQKSDVPIGSKLWVIKK
jgi:hypothetical protein